MLIYCCFFQPQFYPQLFSALDKDPNSDAIILILAMEYIALINSKAEQMSDMMIAALVQGMKKVKKPVYVVFFRTAFEPNYFTGNNTRNTAILANPSRTWPKL